jgi:GntR family transcriptional regulator/MocR family aminotransferase
LNWFDMLLTLDGNGPRYAQITRAIRRMIQDGVLPFDARLPPTRELARDFGCSRNIVLLAYEQLVLEGYLVTRQGAGTFVSPAWPRAAGRPARISSPSRSGEVVRLSQRGRAAVDVADRARGAMTRRPGMAIDFIYGLCEPDSRVMVRLRSAFHAAIREHAFRYGPPAGDPDLRRQIADRIRAARGITRSADQIVVTSGAQQALGICARLLLDPGDHVVVEEPGYAAAHAVFVAAGAKVIRVPVDGQGLDPSKLPQDRSPVRAIYVTPSHQFPTGAVMPAARRYALLEWAKRRDAYVIEDDYDGEFRYVGRPIAALAGLEAEGTVIYCGTFAKSLFPSLRLGYLAVPAGLARAVENGKWLCDLGSSWLLQRTLTQLMATGEYDRHIRRMQKRYRDRRQALLTALDRDLGAEAQVEGSAAGLHVVVWLPNLPRDRMTALIEASAAKGVGVYSIAGHATRPLSSEGLLLGYGLTDVGQIQRGVKALAEAYREVTAADRRSRDQRTGDQKIREKLRL